MKSIAIISTIALALGIIASLLVNYYASVESLTKWYFAIGMSLGLPVLTNLILHRITHEKSITELKTEILKIKSVMSDIENLMDLPDERKAISDLANNINSLNRFYDAPFFRKQAAIQLKEFCELIKEMANGVYECSPEEEIFLTKNIILDTTGSLKAVSYQDTDWWIGTEGNSYLSLHLNAIREGKVTSAIRIFIADNDEKALLTDVINKHNEYDVETFVLNPCEVPRDCLKDFVIYGDFIVREADSPMQGVLGKKARFSKKDTELYKAIERFEILERIARGKTEE